MVAARLTCALAVALPLTLMGCLSNSYVVQHDELARLATVDPASRGASIRAVQQIGGDDDPPGGAAVDPVPPTPVHTVFIETVVVEPQGGPHRDREHHGSTTHTSHSEKGSPSKKGNGDSADAVVIAAAVVAGAGMTLALAGSEGARYDGWLAVPSEEMMHLELPDGLERDVPLSALTPYDVASADRAILYEGKDGRYLRLGRAPLDRAGFTMGTAFHMGGISQVEGGVATGAGGYLHIGGNIANYVTLGMTGTIDSGLNAKEPVLLATLAPEIEVFPLRYFGFYGGYGWLFRNTSIDARTRADAGSFFRVGAIAELPLTTRLGLQARLGLADQFLPEGPRLVAEGQLGLAIY